MGGDSPNAGSSLFLNLRLLHYQRSQQIKRAAQWHVSSLLGFGVGIWDCQFDGKLARMLGKRSKTERCPQHRALCQIHKMQAPKKQSFCGHWSGISVHMEHPPASVSGSCFWVRLRTWKMLLLRGVLKHKPTPKKNRTMGVSKMPPSLHTHRDTHIHTIALNLALLRCGCASYAEETSQV